MENLYLVDYEVDLGWDKIRDQALVFGDCINTAKYRLSEYVESIAPEYVVSHYYSVEKYNEYVHGYVFCNKF